MRLYIYIWRRENEEAKIADAGVSDARIADAGFASQGWHKREVRGREENADAVYGFCVALTQGNTDAGTDSA